MGGVGMIWGLEHARFPFWGYGKFPPSLHTTRGLFMTSSALETQRGMEVLLCAPSRGKTCIIRFRVLALKAHGMG